METDWGIIVIRLGLYLSLMVLMGLAAFPLYALRGIERTEGRILNLRNTLIFWLSAAIILSVIGFLVLMAAMMGTSIANIDWEMCSTVLFGTPIGTAWLIRMAALAAALLAALIIIRSDYLRLMAITGEGAVALATALSD